jgi:radical SAM family uncharacterized protein
MREIISEQILPNVLKPGRYIGNEFNSIHKDWEKTPYKIALIFPDIYEIGMSNLGLQILYHIINQEKDLLAERAYTPWPDMEEALKKNNIPLFSLESWKPIKDFDLIGFGIAHELTYTNIINILHLGNIPLRQKERSDKDPLIMGGGPCTFNPEPIADFFDFFVIGEAEEVILDIVNCLKKLKAENRKLKIEALAKIPGIYVPSLKNQTVKQHIKDLDHVPYPTKPIVPFIEAVHDRAMIEIMRGCKWGCKFCHAGWTTRPLREKNIDQLIKTADELIKNTGFEELSLVSLSSSDYSQIEELAKTLAKKYESKRVNLSLPSLRTNTFSIKLAKEISRVRPSGVTIAPEAGTQRLRDVIGKNMTEEQILSGVRDAFSEGIEAIKLYFMLGLPTETEADLAGIGELSKKIFETGKTYTKRARVTVNLATFIPKSHTPFQWEEQIGIAQTYEKQKLIKNLLKVKGIEVRWHQAEASFLEGVFARGDRNLSRVLEKAWQLGARLDAWHEYLKFDLWQKAFEECGIDPNQYLAERKKDEPLPWDHIGTGIPKELLLRAADKS